MNKTRWILLLRDIKKSMAVFLSITIIVTLGILVYIGISFASMGTKDTMNHFFQTTSYMDFQIHSSTGFTQEDISAVSALENITIVEGGYEIAAYMAPASGEKNKLVVSVQSLTNNVNTITLIDGRLPNAPNECVIEGLLSEQFQIGDTIQVDTRDSNHISLLMEETLIVTGIINHPFNMVDIEERRGISVLGNGCIQNFIYVNSSAFDSTLLADRYQTLYVKADTNAHTYSEEYSAFSDKVETALKALGDERAGQDAWRIVDLSLSIPHTGAEVYYDNYQSLSASFGLIFMVVSAMVCYTSFGRKINEQQRIIGIQKAQGFHLREILFHYIAYACIATFLGVCLGSVLGYFTIQNVLIKSSYTNWQIYEYVPAIIPQNLLIGTIVAFTINILATLLAVLRTLRSPASDLMRDRGTSGRGLRKSRILSKIKLSLRNAIALRNLILNPGKTLTTILVTAGCTTLVLIGISIKFSLNSIPDTQFGKLIQYDRILTADTRFGQGNELTEILDTYPDVEYLPVTSYAGTFRYGDDGSMACVTITDEAFIHDYFSLKDPETGNELILPENGILLSIRAGEFFGIKEGDEIEFTEPDGTTYTLKVHGFFTNYVDHLIFMSDTYYQDITGEDAINNQFYIKLNATDEADLKEALSASDAFIRLVHSDYRRGQFDSLAGVLDIIMWILIALSAALSAVTLFNLNAMTMMQKSYELNVMRANGFTIKETKSYFTKENRIMTLIGIALGIFFGNYLSSFVRAAIESDIVKIPEGLSPIAIIISCILTWIFAELMQGLFLLKLNRGKAIRMND